MRLLLSAVKVLSLAKLSLEMPLLESKELWQKGWAILNHLSCKEKRPRNYIQTLCTPDAKMAL